MKTAIFYLGCLICICSCSNPPIRGNDVVGAREFVIDSYKIREGKLSILEMEGKKSVSLSKEYFQETKEVIVNGDILDISLFHPARENIAPYVKEIGKNIGYKVENDFIVLPDLPPQKVEGLTIEEAKERLQQAYHDLIPNVEVFISYKKKKHLYASLIGMVPQTQVPIEENTRLFDLLSKAKLPSNANLFKSYLIRGNQALPVDFYRLVALGDMSQNIIVKGGDKIFIADPNASAIMVMGEVARQGAYPISSNSIPLQEALGKAGGMLFTGSRAYIQVIRGNLIKPKIYTLSWKHIVRLPTDSMLLIPGDILYVAANPITEWNRVINQLLPSFTVYELFSKGVKGVFVQDGISN